MNKEIQKLLRESNINDYDKNTIKFLVESLETNNLGEFNDKTFLFEGDPGIGKTYFVENLIKNLGLPVFFIGPFSLEYDKSRQFKTLEEAAKEFYKAEEGILFIDDLQNSLQIERDACGEIQLIDSERKTFLNLLEHIIRKSKNKLLFLTLNDNSILEEPWLDRIEAHIDLEEPKEKSKKIYLSNKYSKYLKKSLINEISEKSFGYNFRNLDELVRISFREGKGKITQKHIRKAFSIYSPTSIAYYDIIHRTGVKFKDIIGNESLKKELLFLKHYIKYPKFFSNSEIERSNVVIFNGPPGTGKTFMAKAIAGELDVPLINIDAMVFYGNGPIGPVAGVRRIAKIASRFRNCIIFVDELDKLIGQQLLAEDNEIIGSLEAHLDGIKKRTNAIIIFTMNNKARFGRAFHDRVPCFEFEYPNDTERRLFIEGKIKKIGLPINQEQIDTIVRETEKNSYRHIEKIWNSIIFRLMENSESKIRNNRLIATKENINQAITEILGYSKTLNTAGYFG